MTYFIWTVAILMAINGLGLVYWLAKHDIPPRTPFEVACDIVLNFSCVGWALWLLAQGTGNA